MDLNWDESPSSTADVTITPAGVAAFDQLDALLGQIAEQVGRHYKRLCQAGIPVAVAGKLIRDMHGAQMEFLFEFGGGDDSE